MENAVAIAAVAGPIYLILGLSMLLYKKSWHNLLESWKKDHFGLFSVMTMHLILGIIIIRMYNVWEWNVWLLVTISGWAMFLKGVFYFLFSGDSIMWMIKMKQQGSTIYLGGVAALALGGILTYYTYCI